MIHAGGGQQDGSRADQESSVYRWWSRWSRLRASGAGRAVSGCSNDAGTAGAMDVEPES